MAVCLVISKSQDPFSNVLHIFKEHMLTFPPASLFCLSKPDTGTNSSCTVSEHLLKIIHMHLLNP